MTTPEQEVLATLVAAVAETGAGCEEAVEVLGPLPGHPEALGDLTTLQRLAARALLKSVEQRQDLLARMLRVLLLLEQENIDGFSARAIADRAEGLGIIGSSDAWSALVRLRNRLAHEYPLGRVTQLARLADALAAAAEMNRIAADIDHFIQARGLLP